jgi:putative component of toxin-antitoxin plasmid stabilization module
MRSLLVSGLLCTATAAAAAQQPTRYVLRGEAAIYNLAGQVRIQGGTGSDVQVEVTLGGGDAGRLRVQTGPIDDRETLRVIYPGDEVTYRRGSGRSSTELHVRDDGTFSDGRGRGRKVRIRNYGDGIDAWADLVVSVPAGRKVAVRLAVGEATVANVNGNILVDVHAADVTAEHTAGILTLDTGSGDITARDIQGEVLLDTGSGNVTATGVRGGVLTLDTGSGDVTVAQADVTELRIDTGSGDVDATGVRARTVMIDTGSGQVSLTLLTDVDDVEIDTGSGDVTLTVPAALGAEIEIDTSSGDIDLGFAIEVRQVQRDHLIGRIGDGVGRMRLDTGSGDVRLLRQ